jgi:hypothetical protein
MKRSNISTNNLIALTLTAIFVASVFLTGSSVVANARVAKPRGVKPVRGIDVIVEKEPGNSASREAQTNADGGFTLSDLTAGQYKFAVACRGGCAARVVAELPIIITLTGAGERNFKRSFSKRQLEAGVTFQVQFTGKQVSGVVYQEEK